jgi:hypothetical protein
MIMRRILLSLSLVLSLFAPALAQAQVIVQGVRVSAPPPPLRAEVRPVAPSLRHQWIPGHWAWRGGGHYWIPGYYALPPAEGYHWVHARWVNEGGTWVFYEGHWALNQPTQPTYVYEPGPPPPQEVVVQQAPPPDVVEVRPAAPFGGAVWIPGYWHWNGYRHSWVGGHWSAPRAGWAWEPHHWVRAPGGWRWAPGHWRRL